MSYYKTVDAEDQQEHSKIMFPFQYTCGAAPKPLMPDGVQCTFVDENDGRLKYGPGWMLSAIPFGAQPTAHIATTNGSTVVVDFNGEPHVSD